MRRRFLLIGKINETFADSRDKFAYDNIRKGLEMSSYFIYFSKSSKEIMIQSIVRKL